MKKNFTSAGDPLYIPGSSARLIRRPDARGLITPAPNPAPLTSTLPYDDLFIAKAWREYDNGTQTEVKYFCYELHQIGPYETQEDRYFKVVRLHRLTRVPRYLRQSGSGGGSYGHVFSSMRDVLVGLRQQNILFCHLIAKSPELPLIFAYGVQGIADTLEEARELADEAYEALCASLDGVYQQLDYQPLNYSEGELLARYQTQWQHVAIARGRPMPQGVSLGSSSAYDGNRTDIESANNQLEAFIRGMVDKSFILSLVTVPLSIADMSLAVSNLSKHLSAVRSDTDGTRGFSAGFAVPLGMGASMGDTSGTTHGATDTGTTGTTDSTGSSTSHAVGVSNTDTLSQTDGTTHTAGVNAGTGSNHTDNASLGQNTSLTDTSGTSDTHTGGTNVGSSDTATAGITNTQGNTSTVGDSHSLGNTQSVNQSHGVSSGQSVATSQTDSANWSHGANQGVSAGQSASSGWNQSSTDSLSQTNSTGLSTNEGTSSSGTVGDGSSVSGGIPGLLNGGANSSSSQTGGVNSGTGHNFGVSQTGGSANSQGVSGQYGTNYGTSSGISESAGGSQSVGTTSGYNVGVNDSVTSGQSLSSTDGVSSSQAASQSAANSQSLAHGLSSGSSVSDARGLSSSNALGQGVSATQGNADGVSASQGTSNSVAGTTSTGNSSATGVSNTNQSGQNASTAQSISSAQADSWSVAMSRQMTHAGSLGIVPTLSASVTKQTRNEDRRLTGDILEAKRDRYVDGMEGGGMLYQMTLVAPDKATAVAAATTMKTAFWGPGSNNKRLDSPFHTHVIVDEDEADRIRLHAASFTSYLKPEPTPELLEKELYSTFVTMGEVSCFCHPPTIEAPGLQAQVDSMPVMAMPADRTDKKIYLGHVVNGERGRVSDVRFGLDPSELTHALIQGLTGLGKTTTMLRMLEQLASLSQSYTVYDSVDPSQPPIEKELLASALVLDWMQNSRKLAHVLPAERFQLFSITNPRIGRFRFNPLQIPDYSMDPADWAGAISDNLAASAGLGDFGRNLIYEFVDALFSANRLEDFVLAQALSDPVTGEVKRPAFILPAIDPTSLPQGAVITDSLGNQYANVYSCPELSRLVDLPSLAILVKDKIEYMTTSEGMKLLSPNTKERLNSLWRRVQNLVPGEPMAQILAADPNWETHECLQVLDLVNPETGIFTVIETDGLTMEGRRIIIGSLMLAIYRFGLFRGSQRYFDCGGKGPGTFIFLEESHELLAADPTEGRDASGHRAALYESMFRRGRQTGLKLVAMTQNCSQIPPAIVSQATTLIAHRTTDEADRRTLCSQLNWLSAVMQQQREYRYLGEMPIGWAIVKLSAQTSYLESAPIQIKVDDLNLPDVDDDTLAQLARSRGY